jgi:prepilin-type N-terminal cleavage/methylation domain-containing protein
MILPQLRSPVSRIKYHNKGFTLIELLIVIAIIGILMSLGFASFQRAQMNARDSRRIQDMDQMKIALEFYFENNHTYPTGVTGQIKDAACNGGVAIGWGDPFICGGENYMKVLPDAPGTTDYWYVSTVTGFQLFALMENNNNGNLSPPANYGGTDYNYRLENEK